MQYSIVNLSEVKENDRLSAEFWNPKYLKYLKYNKKFVLIGDILTQCQYGLSRDMNEENIGIPIYRMNEFDEIFLDKANKTTMVSEKEFNDFKLHINDVLFNRTNSFTFVGRTGILKHETNSIFASYLIRLIPDTSKILPEYLTIYLNTNIGIQQVKRRAMESINQANVSGSEIKKVPIFLLNMNLQLIIADLVNTSYTLRQSADTLYKEAENILLEELGLKDFKPQNKKCFIKNLSNTQEVGRFDAEYFQPKYEDIIEKIKGYKGGYNSLKQICDITSGSFVSDEFYCEKGLIPYIRVKDLNFKGGINKKTIIYLKKFLINKETVAYTGDYIIATIGTVGKISIIDNKLNGCIPSNNTSKISLKNKQNELFYLLLFQSFIFQQQIERQYTQTAQPKISDSQLYEVIIPLLPQSIQILISSKIQQSFENREKSKRLLDVAKRAVEIAIEEDEESGLKYIKENR